MIEDLFVTIGIGSATGYRMKGFKRDMKEFIIIMRSAEVLT